MGALADAGDVDVITGQRGDGARLVMWWREVADDDDRALLREWAESRVAHRVIADRLTASGFTIHRHTVMEGIRQLRSIEWAT